MVSALVRAQYKGKYCKRQPFCGKDCLIIADLERLLIWRSLGGHSETMYDGWKSVFKASRYNRQRAVGRWTN